MSEGEQEFVSREPIEFARRRILAAAEDGDWVAVRAIVKAVRDEHFSGDVDPTELRLAMRRLIDEPDDSQEQRALGGVMRLALRARYTDSTHRWKVASWTKSRS